MRDSGGRIRNYWRVIHSDGSVPENFTAPADRGPKDPYSARQKLMTEGIRFSADGFADPTSTSHTRSGYEPANDRWPMRRPQPSSATSASSRRSTSGASPKVHAPLTAAQEAEMLGRLAAERTAGRG